MGKKYIKVGFSTYYYGPDTPAAREFLRATMEADLSNHSEWLHPEIVEVDEDEDVIAAGEVADWVWAGLEEECPHVDEEGHDENCEICEGEGSYVPGWGVPE